MSGATQFEETYQFKDPDSARDAIDEIDAFERRLAGGERPAPKKAAVASGVPRAKPVAAKKGSDYVQAAVKPPQQRTEDEDDTTQADMKAVSELDNFPHGKEDDDDNF
eukprot:CAMPEP_0174722198 /NCGR_PEP_ID=MMETSP1094-20130205/37838_1 /TAXON_ID=156173 /ORGANISM="Chrysochromulina brevifilum, Strain UTEX LB 985" /LENGTH=107 /DNA_ID=CAMNT_0015923007 /DNA_START=70 /DNA_END=393 /DNA_ORIENTATION=+